MKTKSTKTKKEKVVNTLK